jgi:hypothetical protein
MQSIYGYLRGRDDDEQERRERTSKKPEIDPYPDTLEMEKNRERSSSLNRQEGVFAQPRQGLNRTQSIFEKTAVFHVEDR